MDERAIAAALELLVEAGFEGTTIQAVAKRSGVHASAIYRRWSSRIELIEEAVFPGFSPPAVAPTGDLRADLRRFVRAYVAVFEAPATRAAMPGMVLHYQSTSGRSPDDYIRVSARPQFQDILVAAPAGSVDAEVDPDDVFDVLLGALMARVVVPTIAARRRPIERLVDLVVRMLQPATDRIDVAGGQTR